MSAGDHSPHLGPIYTMNEAAGRLRISRRALQELVKQHPHYCSNGRRKLFTEKDLVALVTAMREAHPAPIRPTDANRRSSRSAKGGGAMWAEVQRRLAVLRQQDSQRRERKAPRS